MSTPDTTSPSAPSAAQPGIMSDVEAMLSARIELARLELDDVAESSRKLGTKLAIGVTLLILGLGPIVLVLGEKLAAHMQWTRESTLVGLGVAMLLVGGWIAYAATRGFKALHPWADSSAELREDLAWLREIAKQ